MEDKERQQYRRLLRLERTYSRIFVVLLAISIFANMWLEDEYQKKQETLDFCDRMDMHFNDTIHPNYLINGHAVSDRYYCVWTKDRTAQEVADTDEEEKCHVLIDKDTEHYCGKLIEKACALGCK